MVNWLLDWLIGYSYFHHSIVLKATSSIILIPVCSLWIYSQVLTRTIVKYCKIIDLNCALFTAVRISKLVGFLLVCVCMVEDRHFWRNRVDRKKCFLWCIWVLTSASHDNWCTGTLLNRIITAQWEGMGDVGSARYEPALLHPCPTIKVLSYSNCQRWTHSISKWIFRNLAV